LVLATAAKAPIHQNIRAAVAEGVDWERLCALAASEKAAAILLGHLRLAGADTSSHGFDHMRRLATLSVMQMIQLEKLLHQTLDKLAERNIDVMLLKGAGLAYTAYESFARRPMGDIDLLTRPDDGEHAWSLFRGNGWTPLNVDGGLPRYVGHHHLPPLLEDSTNCRLEIHTDVLPEEHPFQFSTAAFWQSAKRITVGGHIVSVPDPIHQLWHVCVHFAWSDTMQVGSWRALRDIAVLGSEAKFDWPQFVSFARETRAATACYWPLRIARNLTSAEIPDEVLTSLRPPYPEWTLARLERHFMSTLFRSERLCPSVWLTHKLWSMAMAPSWSGHGRARPWQVSERLSAASTSEPASLRVPMTAKVRQIAAVASYMLRLGGFGSPGYSATARASL
jgi:hypothetical protein